MMQHVDAIMMPTILDEIPDDEGCEVTCSCLGCPLPQCRYDDPAWYRRSKRFANDLLRMKIIRVEGLTVHEAAERFEITVRTVFRIQRRCRLAEPSAVEEVAPFITMLELEYASLALFRVR